MSGADDGAAALGCHDGSGGAVRRRGHHAAFPIVPQSRARPTARHRAEAESLGEPGDRDRNGLRGELARRTGIPRRARSAAPHGELRRDGPARRPRRRHLTRVCRGTLGPTVLHHARIHRCEHGDAGRPAFGAARRARELRPSPSRHSGHRPDKRDILDRAVLRAHGGDRGGEDGRTGAHLSRGSVSVRCLPVGWPSRCPRLELDIVETGRLGVVCGAGRVLLVRR